MGSYDSDDSMSDDEAGISTNVLLGYASKEPTEDPTSHLGGIPTWLDAAHPPSYAYSRCRSCTQPMSLLLELNTDLPDRFPGHERRLYIWACRKKQCRRKPGSIRALRNVRVSADAAPVSNGGTADVSSPSLPGQQQKLDLGAQLFGGSNSNPFAAPSSGNPFSSTSASPAAAATDANSSNPFSPSSNASTTADLATTFAQKARITDPAQDNLPHPVSPAPSPYTPPPFEPWPTPADATPHPHFHLDADYEYLTTEPAAGPSAAHAALLDADTDTGDSGTAGAAPLPDDRLDRAFQAFADALAQNPEQVLRYAFAGSPLLSARDDGVARVLRVSGMPACEACGAARAFEAQLVPGAIAALEEELEVGRVLAEGMEWATVLVGVCTADCADGAGGVSAREEWVGVQWEEVVARGGGAGVERGVDKGVDKGAGKSKGKGKG